MSSAITNYTEQRAWLELLGGVGAAILGAGVALVFRYVLAPLAVPLLLVGLVAHGLGMWGKHRLDASGSTAMPPWTLWAYWVCWALIAGLVVYLASGPW
jgi:hypothetical protein